MRGLVAVVLLAAALMVLAALAAGLLGVAHPAAAKAAAGVAVGAIAVMVTVMVGAVVGAAAPKSPAITRMAQPEIRTTPEKETRAGPTPATAARRPGRAKSDLIP